MISRDSKGEERSVGGGVVFVQLEEECLVMDNFPGLTVAEQMRANNFRCDTIPNQKEILFDEIGNTKYIQMNDLNNGKYEIDVMVKRVGKVTMSVMVANKGGFFGQYFNNAFMQGEPAMSRIDSELDFDWGTGLITE